MYRWLEQNIGAIALSKDEMTTVWQAQKLYHEDWKDVSKVAAEIGISEEQAAKHIGYNTHSLSVHDLVPDTEDSDPFEFLLQGSLAIPVDRMVHWKICTEYLEELFGQLSAEGQVHSRSLLWRLWFAIEAMEISAGYDGQALFLVMMRCVQLGRPHP